jgi:ATP-binding cassette, subfamily B, bacterial
MLKDKQYTKKGALLPFLKRIFRYSMRKKKWFWGFVITVSIVAMIDAVFPLIWLNLVDEVIVPQVGLYLSGESYTTEADFSGIYKYVSLFVALGFIQLIMVFLFIRFTGSIQEFVMYELRKEMFEKLQKLSFSFYDKSAIGWLLSRITSDTNRVTELISWGFLEGMWGIVMIIACFIAMMIYNWKLALIVMLTIPVLILVSVRIRMLILKYSRESRKINSELTANYNEHINGVEVNKSLAQEEKATAEFARMSEKMRNSSYKSQYFTAMYVPMVIFIGSFAAAFIIYAGGKMAISIPAGITVGVLAAFFGYATRIFEPIMDITRFYAMAQGSLSAGERIFSLIDEPVEITDKPGIGHYGELKGEIEFVNVDFRYVEGKPVFENLNLKILPGQSVALVGESGGGKSTIVNLISRFYEPVSGEVRIDGIDYREKTLHSLRSQFGIVLQTPHLYSGTIRENIRYSRNNISDDRVIEVLETIGAENFIPRLNEEVGEGGERLSLGEKQLISFARALINDPKIFIMDEATSSVDTLTEQKIQKGIEKIISNRTSIIIAHRLSTIKNCNRILVVVKGKIVEDGSHKELVQKKGYYYRLYTNQLRKERTDALMHVKVSNSWFQVSS